MLTITTFPYPAYTQQLIMQNANYQVGLTWNCRGAFWFMDVLDQNGNPIAMGIPLTCTGNLFGPYPDIGLPAGTMLAVDMPDTGEPIAYDDLTNGRIQIVYLEADGT